ncbi:MAG: DUF5916 domain-containing protein [Ignavibacteriaceae bacterium]
MIRLYIIILLAAFTLNAQQENEKRIELRKIEGNIRIDGIIDEAWSLADSVDDFVQHSPYTGKTPSQRTVLRLLSGETSLFALVVAFSPRDKITVYPGKFDDANGDGVSLMLDTFNDKKTAYKLVVSSSGARMDARLLDDARNRDYSWDGIWFADAEVYDWGYVVEIEVPYKSLQFDEKATSWGLDVDRWILNPVVEDIYWNKYDEGEGQRISRFGKLVFKDFTPELTGLSLELYPVGLMKASYLYDSKYKFEASGGFDLFYNPSPKLTLMQTLYPDYAQIEADPYDFNISRYETYFTERRPFFSEGNEIFNPSGKEHNSGFYSPLELLYTRRIGKKLPDGSEVPLITGSKVFGRLDSWEYGAFFALTGEKDYMLDDSAATEQQAYFSSVRVKKNIFDNSTIGLLYAGKVTNNKFQGVVDIDGAFRQENWQFAYQLARSFDDSEGDYATSFGLKHRFSEWGTLVRGRYIGEDFNVSQVGYVPWKGNTDLVILSGPNPYFESGALRNLFFFPGIGLNYNREDDFLDYSLILGLNMSFRQSWGYELTFVGGKSRDRNVKYTSYEINLSSWFFTSPNYHANVWMGYAKTYNFAREYLSFFTWGGFSFDYNLFNVLFVGTTYDTYIEGDPDYKVEDVVLNARPYISFTPVNHLNLRLYVDNLYVRSTDKLESMIVGFLFSYNFSPKSWIYFAVNEIHNRQDEVDPFGKFVQRKFMLDERVMVLKLKYLYYL